MEDGEPHFSRVIGPDPAEGAWARTLAATRAVADALSIILPLRCGELSLLKGKNLLKPSMGASYEPKADAGEGLLCIHTGRENSTVEAGGYTTPPSHRIGPLTGV